MVALEALVDDHHQLRLERARFQHTTRPAMADYEIGSLHIRKQAGLQIKYLYYYAQRIATAFDVFYLISAGLPGLQYESFTS